MTPILARPLSVLVALFFCLPICHAAGDPDYRATSARIRQEMDSLKLPEFAQRKVPERFRNESFVLLADFTSIQAGIAKGKKHGWLLYREINRCLVALQDDAAVKAWSERSYNEFNSRNTWFGKLDSRVVVGVRVYKADGSVSEINPEEDEIRRKYSIGQGVHLAIPDLQRGDLLDIYSVIESDGEPANFGVYHYQFGLNKAYPVLNRRVVCETGPDFASEFHNINGAPAFHTEEVGPKRWKISFFADSLARRSRHLSFVNEKRQFPLLQLNVMRGDITPYTSLTRRMPGSIHPDPGSQRFIWEELIRLNNEKRAVLGIGGMLLRQKSAGVTAYFDSLARAKREFDVDSLAAELYYMFRFDYAFNLLPVLNAQAVANLPRVLFEPELFHYLLSEYFKLHKLDAELVVASPLTEPPMADGIDSRDFALLTTIRGGMDALFGAASLYAPAFSVQRPVEGVSDGIAVDTKGESSVMARDYATRPVLIPFSEASDNVRSEVLSLVPDTDCSGLRIARSTRLTGHCKDGIQERLLAVDDFYDYERRFFNDTRTLTERVLDRKNPGTIGAELKSALAAVHLEQQKQFEAEAKRWVCPELTDIQQAMVRNPGTRHTDPVFLYTSRFRANSLLRPAGNNFLLQIGQLVNELPDPGAGARERDSEAFLNFASTYHGSYTIRIPAGFSPAGIEALNKKVENESGAFIATATREGDVITVELALVCHKSVYSPAEWGRLVDVLEAASGWRSSKILFRKDA